MQPDRLPTLVVDGFLATHYKDLEEGKWMRVKGWRDAAGARREIMQSVERYNRRTPKPNFEEFSA